MHAHSSSALALALTLNGFTCVCAGAPEPAADSAPNVWDHTYSTAQEAWQRSRDFTEQAAQDVQRLFSDEDSATIGQVWDDTIPTLEQTLELEKRQQVLPEKTWFGPDQRSNQAHINDLLDQAVSLLTVSPTLKYRAQIRALQKKIEAARNDIAGYRQKRFSAPEQSALTRTVSDYDELIAAREHDIRQMTQERDRVKREFAQQLRGIGLQLSDEQLDFLLSTVVGDDMIELGILFDNVKTITGQLEQLVNDSGEDLANARRYYGLYVILLQTLQRMHTRIEEAINERYLPQIDQIIKKAQALSGETRTLQHTNPDKQSVLAANLQAQQLTIEAANTYRQYLKEQALQIEQSRQELKGDIDTAWNTYQTVRVSGELVDLVHASQHLLDGLMNRQVPALRPFRNEQMQREFQKLTDQLNLGATR